MTKTTLIIGGARSGKSSHAIELARRASPAVLFVATAGAFDEEMKQRIEEHKRSRPATWRTLEVQTNVGNRIRQEIGEARVVIVDCIALLVSNVLGQHYRADKGAGELKALEKAVTGEIGELIECFRQVKASFIVVSNEVGTGIVPADRMTRLYRDLLGKANQMLAQQADEVFLMVAGIPLAMKKGRSS